MTADRTNTGPGTGPGPGKAQPDGASPTRPPAPGKADGRDDEIAKQSMAELSRRLGERAARQSAVDPRAAAEARRAALQAYDLARERRLKLALHVGGSAVAAAGVAYFIVMIGSSPVPPSPNATASTEPTSPIKMATVVLAPAPPEQPSPSPPPSSPSPAATPAAPSPLPPPASAASARPSPAETTEPAPATAGQPAPVEPAPIQTALRRDDVREVQARLRSFGFNPGPADGVAGRTTEGAVMHYQQERGQPQTGQVDSQLLEQLRQDPAPQVAQQVAQRAARPDARATRSPAARRSDPFEPVRVAGNRLGRWLDSLTR